MKIATNSQKLQGAAFFKNNSFFFVFFDSVRRNLLALMKRIWPERDLRLTIKYEKRKRRKREPRRRASVVKVLVSKSVSVWELLVSMLIESTTPCFFLVLCLVNTRVTPQLSRGP